VITGPILGKFGGEDRSLSLGFLRPVQDYARFILVRVLAVHDVKEVSHPRSLHGDGDLDATNELLYSYEYVEETILVVKPNHPAVGVAWRRSK
jgi:hypothetical protein